MVRARRRSRPGCSAMRQPRGVTSDRGCRSGKRRGAAGQIGAGAAVREFGLGWGGSPGSSTAMIRAASIGVGARHRSDPGRAAWRPGKRLLFGHVSDVIGGAGVGPRVSRSPDPSAGPGDRLPSARPRRWAPSSVVLSQSGCLSPRPPARPAWWSLVLVVVLAGFRRLFPAGVDVGPLRGAHAAADPSRAVLGVLLAAFESLALRAFDAGAEDGGRDHSHHADSDPDEGSQGADHDRDDRGGVHRYAPCPRHRPAPGPGRPASRHGWPDGRRAGERRGTSRPAPVSLASRAGPRALRGGSRHDHDDPGVTGLRR